MPSHHHPAFPRHPLSTAIQAAITATALSLPLWVQAADANGNVVNAVGGSNIPTSAIVANPFEPGEQAIVGGHSQDGSANSNSLTLAGTAAEMAVPVDFEGTIVGGLSETGSANSNSVTLNTGGYGGVYEVMGGQVIEGAGSASGNSVTINSAALSGVDVAGGSVESGSGNANDNTVTFTGSEVGTLLGGFVSPDGSGSATGNKVVVNGGRVLGDVTESNQNSGGTSVGVAGAYVKGSGNANNNAVVIDGDTVVDGYVTGGLSENGNADGNTVTISGGTFNAPAYTAANGETATEIHGGRTFGAGATASNNTVTISNIQSNAWVVGGVVDTGAGGDANNNTVTILSGTMGSVNGGSANGSGNATGNVVNIQGGTIAGQWDEDAQAQVLGGVVGADVFHGTASNNTIVITGGTINGLIAGGYVDDEKDYDNAQATGSVIKNTITVQGNTADLSNARLFGGWGTTTTGDLFTGNTLNLEGVNGLAVQEVGNFEFLNFALPESTQSGDTILKVAGTADIRGSTLGVRVLGSDPVLEVGDTVNLIEAGELKADEVIKTRGLQGSTIQYTFDTQQNGNTLTSAVTQRGATESSKSLSEGFVAGAAALTAAADFSASQGTAAAVGAVAGAGGSAGGQSFGTTGGGSIRNNTGSHVDVRSFNLVAGLAKGFKQANGELTVGGFFEYGDGNYSSYNDFTSGEVRGSGKTRSYGVGVLGHYALDSGVYVEASLRTGRAEQDYSSDALGSYDSKTHYVGSHIGAGKVWALNDSLGLDTYAHYVWQRQSGDTVKLSTGETLAFEAVTSQRVRLGARLTKGLNETFSAYVGAGYENELDGKARATTNGVPMDSPSMKGDSGLVELGLNVRPLKNKALMLGVGVQGYFGQKEGVTGTLQLGYKF